MTGYWIATLAALIAMTDGDGRWSPLSHSLLRDKPLSRHIARFMVQSEIVDDPLAKQRDAAEQSTKCNGAS
jgi:hypothetical protein